MAKKKKSDEEGTITTQQIAIQLLSEEGVTPEQVVEKLLQDSIAMADQLKAFGMVTSVEPTQDAREKQRILQMAITNGVRQLHTAFHLCGVPNKIRTKVSFPDGDYELQFGRASNILKVMN